jgi:hypothetical protein
MRLVVNQPLPIRLVLGSGMLVINPIPLWANFQIGFGEYNWIRGYHGIYMILVMPLLFVPWSAVFRLYGRHRRQAAPILFLALYLVVNTVLVVATSLELRHFAQFLPAFMILAALPDTREKEVQKEMQTIMACWFALVFVVHLAWAIMKG